MPTETSDRRFRPLVPCSCWRLSSLKKSSTLRSLDFFVPEICLLPVSPISFSKFTSFYYYLLLPARQLLTYPACVLLSINRPTLCLGRQSASTQVFVLYPQQTKSPIFQSLHIPQYSNDYISIYARLRLRYSSVIHWWACLVSCAGHNHPVRNIMNFVWPPHRRTLTNLDGNIQLCLITTSTPCHYACNWSS